MSILKNILGAFVEFKDEENQKPSKVVYNKQSAPNEDAPSITTGNNSDTPNYQPTPSTATTATSPSGYQHHFEELIEEANTKNPLFKGTDFKEFIDSKMDVEAIADEASKYRTAFNVLKRTGLTKERLVTTGNEYLNIVDRDIQAFESVYNQQYRAEVEHKEQLLQQKAQELQNLSEKIEALNKEMKQLSQDVLQSKDKLTQNKNAFVQAGENKKKEIRTELEKIDRYF